MELSLATAATAAVSTAAAVTIAATRIAAAAGLITLGLAGLSTRRASLGLREAALGVELLLTSGERKFFAAIATCQRSITHFRLNLSGHGLRSVTQHL